jgi:alpha-amylase
MSLFLAALAGGCTTRLPPDGPATADLAAEELRASLLTARPDPDGWRQRVIYFVLLDRFRNGDPGNDTLNGEPACNDPDNPHAYQGGDLDGLASHVDYIDTLGADAVWITPLYRGVPDMSGANCGFPGYWVDFADPYVLETEPRYGTPDAFDALLDGLHDRGMPLMLDMVINHAGYDATLLAQHPDWFTDPSDCWLQGDPDIYCSLAGLPDFDHRRPEVTDYLIDAHLAWLDRFDFDAIRMDTVKHVEPDTFAAWTAAMRGRQPDMYMVGELLDEHSFDRFDRYLDAGFDGLFNFPLRRALIDTFARGESVDVAAGRMAETLDRFGEDRAGAMVNLLDNHDVPRFLEEVPWGVPAAEVQGRYHLALTALLTLPGVPQLYYGDEIGMYGGADPHNRRFMPDWAFDPATRAGPHDGFVAAPDQAFDHVQQLLHIRQRTPALQTGTYRELWRQNGPQNNNVWAYLRQTEGSSAIVVHNNGLHATDGAVPLGVGGTFADGVGFEDLLGQAGVGALEVRGGVLSVALPGRSSVILVPDTEPNPVDDTAEVRFEVLADTSWGERVYLTGDEARLGGWDLNQAVPKAPDDCAGTSCRWTSEVVLPLGRAVQFKFVILGEDLSVAWEQGANRELTVAADSEVVTSFR